jgi:hypothetical protein
MPQIVKIFDSTGMVISLTVRDPEINDLISLLGKKDSFACITWEQTKKPMKMYLKCSDIKRIETHEVEIGNGNKYMTLDCAENVRSLLKYE